MPPPPGCRLLAGDKTQHPSKALLCALDPDGDGLITYRRYLSETISFDVDHGMLSLLDRGCLEAMYCMDAPVVPPRFFDFHDGGDLSKLESILDVSIVVVLYRGSSSSPPLKVHDTRPMLLSAPPEERLARRVRRFAAQWVVDEWLLFEREEETEDLEIAGYYPLWSEKAFYTDMMTRFDGCLVSAVCLALGIARVTLESEHVHSPGVCGELSWLLSSPGREELARVFARSGYDVLQIVLASHIRSRLRSRPHLMNHPGANTFAVHGIVGRKPSESIRPDAILVCLTFQGDAYVLGEVYRVSALRFAGVDVGGGGGGKRRRYPPVPKFHEVGERRKRSAEETTTSHEDDRCKCRPCRDAGSLKKNLPERGPQRPIHSPLALVDLVKRCGLFSPEVERSLAVCCSYSLSTFDIETAAVPCTDPRAGNEDLAPFDPSTDTVSQCARPRLAYAVHRPILIGFHDAMALSSEEPPLIFHAREDDGGESMVAAFLETLLERRDEACSAKHELLEPLFSKLSLFKRAHWEFHRDNGMLPASFRYDDYFQSGRGWQRDDDALSTDGSLAECVRELALKLTREEEEEAAGVAQRGDEEEADDDGWETVSDSSSSVEEAPLPLFPDNDEDEDLAKLRRRLDAEALRSVELSWKHSLLGMLETRLDQLANR